jgi:hypothetical protein
MLPIEGAAQAVDHRGEDPTAIEIGKDPVGSPSIEVPESDVSGLAILFQEHRSNQEAAQYEKNHNSKRSCLRMLTGQIIEDPEVVDENKDNGKSPHGIEPANHLGVQDLIELRLNGLEASSRDPSMGHGVDYFISSPRRKSTFRVITVLTG